MWKLPVKVLFVLLMSQQLRKRGATRLWPEQKVLNSCLSLWKHTVVLARKQGHSLMSSQSLLQSRLRSGLLLRPDSWSDQKYRRLCLKATSVLQMPSCNSPTLFAMPLAVTMPFLRAPVFRCLSILTSTIGPFCLQRLQQEQMLSPLQQ